MTAYFVMGAIVVVWALILSAIGLTRDNFPPSGGAMRGLIGFTALLTVATVVVLLAVTKKEHPRIEAAEAEERAAEIKKSAEDTGDDETQTKKQKEVEKQTNPSASTIDAKETEFKIALAGGDAVKAGKVTFDVTNDGQIDHDLAIEGNGIKESKTPLLASGKSAKLAVDLKPGKYTLYCTVPGHEQSGMKVDLTVEK